MAGRARPGLAAVLALSGLVVVAAPARAQDPAAATATIVTFEAPAALDAALDPAADGELAAADPEAQALDDHAALAALTPAEAQALAADPQVASVEPDAPLFTAEAPNDPCYTVPATCGGLGAWHLDRTQLPTAWNLSHANGAVIAVLDSGVNAAVVDLQGRVAGELVPPGVGAVCTSEPAGSNVRHHGTMVSSVAVATPSNGFGTAGTGWGAQVLSVRVFDQGASGCSAAVSDLIAGLDAAVGAGVEVINVSLTTPMESPGLRSAIGRALAAGIPVVAAAGNSGVNNPFLGDGGFPAFWPEVIAVGATSRNPDPGSSRDPRALYQSGGSNFGTWVDIYAPGKAIPAFDRNGSLVLADGTSFAAPLVAGIVSLIRTVAPWAGPDAIAGHLRSGGQPLLDVAGASSVNAFSAMVAAPASDHFLRTTATPGGPDRMFSFGLGSYQNLLCDFDGNGVDGIVAFDRGAWYIRSDASAGPVQAVVTYGAAGYQPVCGDWDGDGTDGIGVFVDGNWYLRQTASAGAPQLAYAYGAAGYQPVVGDWNGDNIDGTGVFVNGSWFLRQTASAGAPALAYAYGAAGYQPVVGDWNGDGVDGTGIFVNGDWHLRETASPGSPNRSFAFGYAGVRPLVGRTGGGAATGTGITLP
jgi:hypothetical protein